MNKKTSNQIDELLKNSGLFSSKNPNLFSDSERYNFQKETILITGAAGSIGSQISKQLIHCQYKRIILADIAESPLYELLKDLEHHNLDNVDYVLIDLNDEESVEWLFQTYKPTIIFHTAAYKHVTLMEENPYEAVKTNIFGTKTLADISVNYKVKKFVFISTDKAVNPISVMGMSKYIAERYLKTLSLKPIKTSFTVTRFGNVFGSSGSIVPLFLKQIENEMPLKVTSKKVSRYFIDKQKACNLILKIALFENMDYSVFTFNMGKPIKVLDLAKRIILLDKFKNDKISIEITKLQPGEKLHEDITSKNEILLSTEHQDILLVKNNNEITEQSLDFEALKKITPYFEPSKIKTILENYV